MTEFDSKPTILHGLHFLRRELTGKMYMFIGFLLCAFTSIFLFDDLNHMLRYFGGLFYQFLCTTREIPGQSP